MRRRLAALAVLTAVALLVAACAGDDDVPDRASPDRAAPGRGAADDEATRRAGPEDAPPPPGDGPTGATGANGAVPGDDDETELDGGPLVVEAQGFSTFPDVVDPRELLASYGVIVGNWDVELLASGVTVTIRLLAADGSELVSDTTMVNGILPARRMAVGRTLVEPIEDPVAMEVDVAVAAWLVPASAEGSLEADDVRTEPDDGGGLVTTFTVRSTWPADEEGVDATAVYRDAGGRIVGAEATTLPRVRGGATTEGSLELLAPIPDLAATEVHVGRGIAALTTG